jgi:hypothetical protein
MVGSGIRKNLFRIPDPGGKKVPDPGSGSATLKNIILRRFRRSKHAIVQGSDLYPIQQESDTQRCRQRTGTWCKLGHSCWPGQPKVGFGRRA